ncbi:MAG: glutamyl-tRNA reductase, partial [bacterium]|nr:glutamyl-tRNA reductase [bacterium]
MAHSTLNPMAPAAAGHPAAASPAERRAPTLHVCGINHVGASIPQRERYALSPEDCARLLRSLKTEAAEAGRDDQFMILSTCNRTEIYGFSASASFAFELREAFLAIGADAADPGAASPPIYEHQGMEAVRHLFSVCAGLDSMILGENQIKQQIRQAYELSQAEGAVGPDLHRLIEATHRTGKRIRTETDLNVGTLCVGKAAVLKGEQVLGDLRGRSCMVIGAGKVGRIAARAISERQPGRLWIVNRSVENAREIVDELGGEAYGLDALACLLPEAEFIIGAAYAPELILSADLYAAQCPADRRPGRVCMVDAALPRIFDPALDAIEGVRLFDIEHMEEIVEENRRRRATAAR